MADIPSAEPGGYHSVPVIVECCRKCSSKYQFKLNSGEIVTVICGRPTTNKYKAVSYLWEETSDLPLKCRYCSVVTKIPMRDASKLWRLMSLVQGDYVVWLDAMSINQNDPKDKEAQLFVMGDIYHGAETVSVLLPSSDEEAFQKLSKLYAKANEIVKRAEAFGLPSLNGSDDIATEQTEVLEKLADDYWTQMSNWTANIHKWSYWRRAWTFQEWARASEIEISCETTQNSECLSNIKNAVVMASTITAHWKKMQVMQSTTASVTEKFRQQLRLREELGRGLNSVRAHFPFEDFLVADAAEELEDLRRRTFTPAVPTIADSGTYITLDALSTPELKFRALLSLALSAISTSKREARYEADLIACWASMCNIEYAYDKEDSFAIALHKVIAPLRKRRIRIYNFLVNTDSAETDLKFLDYAAAHRQSNAYNEGYLVGLSVFIGRADTLTHVRNSLSQTGQLVHLDGNYDILLTQVEKVIFRRPILWCDTENVMSAFRSMLSGKADNTSLFDVGDLVEKLITDMPSDQLQKHFFITVSITVTDVDKMWYFNAWAIYPSEVSTSDLFVARESLNGTLVLAVYKGLFSSKPEVRAKKAQIVSYLNMTHQRDGTYLVKSDEKGVVDVVFRTEDTPKHELFGLPEIDLRFLGGESLLPEWSVLDVVDDREFDMQISLGARQLPLFRIDGTTDI